MLRPLDVRSGHSASDIDDGERVARIALRATLRPRRSPNPPARVAELVDTLEQLLIDDDALLPADLGLLRGGHVPDLLLALLILLVSLERLVVVAQVLHGFPLLVRALLLLHALLHVIL